MSGATAVGVTLAFNSVGWNTQNVLFNTIDTLVGANYIAGDSGFGLENSADATATVNGGTIDAKGSITVSAENIAQINSTVSNTARRPLLRRSMARGARAYGVCCCSGNWKVSGKATATIKRTPSPRAARTYRGAR